MASGDNLTVEWAGRSVACTDEYERTVWRVLERTIELDRLLSAVAPSPTPADIQQVGRRAKEICDLGTSLIDGRAPEKAEEATMLFARYVLEGAGFLLGIREPLFPDA